MSDEQHIARIRMQALAPQLAEAAAAWAARLGLPLQGDSEFALQLGEAARFLRLVHEGACASFNVTLGQEYNAAHRDHLHVDMGLFHMCR